MSKQQGVICAACLNANVQERRYKCLLCSDYDLCAACFENGATTTGHNADHPMQCIDAIQNLDECSEGEAFSVYQPQSLICPLCAKRGFTETTLQHHVTFAHHETSNEEAASSGVGQLKSVAGEKSKLIVNNDEVESKVDKQNIAWSTTFKPSSMTYSLALSSDESSSDSEPLSIPSVNKRKTKNKKRTLNEFDKKLTAPKRCRRSSDFEEATSSSNVSNIFEPQVIFKCEEVNPERDELSSLQENVLEDQSETANEMADNVRIGQLKREVEAPIVPSVDKPKIKEKGTKCEIDKKCTLLKESLPEANQNDEGSLPNQHRKTSEIQETNRSNVSNGSEHQLVFENEDEEMENQEFVRENEGEQNIKIEARPGYVPTVASNRGVVPGFRFLKLGKIIELLSSMSECLPEVPSGIKENVYFVVDNSRNEERYKSGKRQEYLDDCGVWEKGVKPLTYFMYMNGKLVSVSKKQGEFGMEKVGGKFKLLDPQPQPEDMLVLHRFYHTLRGYSNYKRRLTWVDYDSIGRCRTDVVVVEYIGIYPRHIERFEPRRRFMSFGEILELLSSNDVCLPEVPTGIKENVHFIVDNTRNNMLYKSGMRREFWDDCGAWGKNSAPLAYFVYRDNKLVTVKKKEGLFYCEKIEKKYDYLDPQPQPEEIIILNLSYSALKANPNYRRRISWIDNDPSGTYNSKIAIYEYMGKYPGQFMHSRVIKPEKNKLYVKTKPTFKAKAMDMIKHNTPKNAADELIDESDIYNAPRNLKQIRNMKYNYERNNKVNSNNVYLQNVADHIKLTVNGVFDKHKFIHSVIHFHSGPSVLLYMDEQIQDIKRFCCIGEPAILIIDKTYHLGELLLTTTMFKNNSLVFTETGENPIFLGPSLLHRKLDFETMSAFLTNIASHLTDEEIQNMVIGSDDETTLKKCIARAFAGSTHIVSTHHLTNNINEYLNTKVGIDEQDRNQLINAMFGDHGLTDTNSINAFERKVKKLEKILNEKAPEAFPYMEQKIIPIIRNKFNIPIHAQNIDKDWTHNRPEFLKTLLKREVKYKIEHMTDLIEVLFKFVKSQYIECENALIGIGNYKLTPSFEHYFLKADKWFKKTEYERKAYMKKFCGDKGRNSNRTISALVQLKVSETTLVGRKPHHKKKKAAQRRRKL